MSKIAFIGGGNMAAAIVGGLIADGVRPNDITIVDPNATQRARVQKELGVETSDDTGTACKAADIIVLAVKPQVVPALAEQIYAVTDLNGKLLISIAAGVTISALEALFGDLAIARTMPNTPTLMGLGATSLYVNARTTEAQRKQAETIMGAIGICVPVEREELLDAVTAVSGSGPAYFFLLIEEMIRVGVTLGLSHDDASKLTLQTALGAASMAATRNVTPEELRRRVTSPNGTTHAAITTLQEGGFGALIDAALTACLDRAVELGQG